MSFNYILQNKKIMILYSIIIIVLITLLSSGLYKNKQADFINGYHIGAYNLTQGLGYTNQNGKFITHWPPGYSLYMLPFVENGLKETDFNLKIANSVLGIIWLVILVMIFKETLSNSNVFLILGVSLFWPTMLGIYHVQLAELLFSVVISGFLLTSFKIFNFSKSKIDKHYYFLVLVNGFLFGFASLVKTLILPFLVPYLIIIFRLNYEFNNKLRVKTMLIFLLSVLIVIVPWILIFHKNMGYFGFTTAGLPSIKDGLSQFSNLEVGRIIKDELNNWNSTTDLIRGLYIIFMDYPLSLFWLFCLKAVRVFYATASGGFDNIALCLNLPIFLLFFNSVIKYMMRRSFNPFVSLILMLILLNWFTAVGVLSIFRYMAPIFPFIILFVSYVNQDLFHKIYIYIRNVILRNRKS